MGVSIRRGFSAVQIRSRSRSATASTASLRVRSLRAMSSGSIRGPCRKLAIGQTAKVIVDTDEDPYNNEVTEFTVGISEGGFFRMIASRRTSRQATVPPTTSEWPIIPRGRTQRAR